MVMSEMLYTTAAAVAATSSTFFGLTIYEALPLFVFILNDNVVVPILTN